MPIEQGPLPVEIPRDRNGTFEPQLDALSCEALGPRDPLSYVRSAMQNSTPEFLRRGAGGTWYAHLAGRDVLRTVVMALAEHSIPVLPVKGLVTGPLLYEDIASRPIRDVDIRLRRQDFVRAVRIGRALGWHAKHVVLVGQVLWRVRGVEVDVKCALGPPGLCATAIEDVIARAASRVAPFGFEHLEPELNDHALMLVLNVFKDGLRCTPWAIEDLRRIALHELFRPDTLVERAKAGRVVTALWIVASWLADTHDTPGWRAVKERIGPRPPSGRAAGTYALWRRVGSPRRVGHFVIPSAGDDAWRAAAGLAWATAGLARGYGLRAVDAIVRRSERTRR